MRADGRNNGVAPIFTARYNPVAFLLLGRGADESDRSLRPPKHTRNRLSELSPQTLYDKCLALARNLWWSWHPEVVNLFRDLDPIRWRQLDHNPIALLAEFTPERLEMRAAELVLYSRINHAYRRLKEYMSQHADLGHAPTPACWARSRWPISPPSSASTNRCRSTPAAWACSRATTSRAPAAWACRWWPSACSTTRAISSSTSTSTAISTKSISTRRSRTCRWSRPWAPTASRSP